LSRAAQLFFGLGRTVNANMSCLCRILRRKKGHELEQPPGPQTALVIRRSLQGRYRPEVGSPFFRWRFLPSWFVRLHHFKPIGLRTSWSTP